MVYSRSSAAWCGTIGVNCTHYAHSSGRERYTGAFEMNSSVMIFAAGTDA
jgi:hypothetical protein